MASKIRGARMDAHIQIHGVENLRATLKLTMRIKDWKVVSKIMSENRNDLPYSDYSEFVGLIADLLKRVEKESFVGELDYAKEEPEKE